MNELIAIHSAMIGQALAKTVNARDLHAFLEIGKDFSSWVKVQIVRARLVDGRDYVCSPSGVSDGRGGQNRMDFHLTLDAGKQVAMMSETDKGFDVRDYFLECERRAAAPVVSSQLSRLELLEWAMDSERGRLALEQQIATDAPKVEFAEAVRHMEGLCKLEHVAKTLGWGRNRFIDQLRVDHILLPDRTPHQKYIDRGYFKVVEQNPWRDSAGNMHPTFTTMVTGAGQVWLAKRFAAGKVAA